MPVTVDELPAPVSTRLPRPTSRWPRIGSGGSSVQDDARTLSGIQRGGSGVSIASASSVASSPRVAHQVQSGARVGFWRRLVAMLASALQMVVTGLERAIETLGGKLDPDRVPDAVHEYRRASSSHAQLERAHRLVRAGDSEKGLCIYISLLEADPDDTSLLDTASELLIQLGYPEYGRHLLAKSIALAPESNPNKYVLLSRTQDASEALGSLETALHLLTIQEVDMQHEHGKASAQVKNTRTDIARVFAALSEVFAHDLYMHDSTEDKCRKLVAQALEYDPECKEALRIKREIDVLKRGISIQDPLQTPSGSDSSIQDAAPLQAHTTSEQGSAAEEATTPTSQPRASQAFVSPNNSARVLLEASPDESPTREAEEDGGSRTRRLVASTSHQAPTFFVPQPMACSDISSYAPLLLTEAEHRHAPPSMEDALGGCLESEAVKPTHPASQPWSGTGLHSEQGGKACVAGDGSGQSGCEDGAVLVRGAGDGWVASTSASSPWTEQVDPPTDPEPGHASDREAFFNLIPAGPPPPLVFGTKDSTIPSHQAFSSKTQTVPTFFVPVAAAAPEIQSTTEGEMLKPPVGREVSDAGSCDRALLAIAAHNATRCKVWHDDKDPSETEELVTKDLSVSAQDDSPQLNPHAVPVSDTWHSDLRGSIGLDNKDAQTIIDEHICSRTDGRVVQQLAMKKLVTDAPASIEPDAPSQPNACILQGCQSPAVCMCTRSVHAEAGTDARCSNASGDVRTGSLCGRSAPTPTCMVDACAAGWECKQDGAEVSDDQPLMTIGSPQGSFDKAAAADVLHANETYHESEQVQITAVPTQLASEKDSDAETGNLCTSFAPPLPISLTTSHTTAEISGPEFVSSQTENLPINAPSDHHVPGCVVSSNKPSSSPKPLPTHSAQVADSLQMESQGAAQISAAEQSGHHMGARRSFRPPPLVIASPNTTASPTFSEHWVSLHEPNRLAQLAELRAEVSSMGPAPMRASLDIVSLQTESDMESCATVASPGYAHNDPESSRKECSESQVDIAGHRLFDTNPTDFHTSSGSEDLLAQQTSPQTLSDGSFAELDSKLGVGTKSNGTVTNPLVTAHNRFDDSIAWFDGDMGLEPQLETGAAQQAHAHDMAMSTVYPTLASPSVASDLSIEKYEESRVSASEDVSVVHGNKTTLFSDEIGMQPQEDGGGSGKQSVVEPNQGVRMSMHTVNSHVSGDVAVVGGAELSFACDLGSSAPTQTVQWKVGEGTGGDQSGLDEHLGRSLGGLDARTPNMLVESKVNSSANDDCAEQLQHQCIVKGSSVVTDRGGKSKQKNTKKKKKKVKR